MALREIHRSEEGHVRVGGEKGRIVRENQLKLSFVF